MKKKKLLIIIIIGVVVLAAAGTVVFLILTGRLFGGGGDSSSGMGAPSVVSAVSGSGVSGEAVSAAPSGAAAEPAAQTGNPSLFFEGHYYFQNLTGAALTEIRIAPTGTLNWEDNLLGDQMLNNGETWSQALMLRDVGTTWDLRIKDENDRELVFTGLDFSNMQNFVLTLDGSTPVVRQA